MDQIIPLFVGCARYQITSSRREKGNAFDNTCALTPELNQLLIFEDHREEFYRRYLSFKFRALLALEQEQDKAEIFKREFNGIEGLDESVEAGELKESLDFFVLRERDAYLARLSQLSKESVVRYYYFDHVDFFNWAAYIEEKYLWFRAAFRTETRHNVRQRLQELYHKETIDFVDEINLEYFERRVISDIGDHQRTVFARLRQRQLVDPEPSTESEIAENERHILHLDKEGQATVRNIISEISEILAQQEVPTLLEFMQVVVRCIASRYECAFADFLYLDSGGENLRFAVSSRRTSEAEIEAAGGRLHYRAGQGISGSVCYVGSDTDARWVGTNDFAHDSRGSLFHLTHAESLEHDLYGVIRDYWLFPVFSLERPTHLRGAVRVVNKHRKPDASGPVWSLLEKLEVAEIARMLELFAPLFPDDELNEERAEGLTSRSAAALLRDQWGARWIDRTFCHILTSHLMRVALRRVEDHPVGCNICIVKRALAGRIQGIMPPYPTARGIENRLHGHTKLYSFVDPSHGTFVFTEDGTFVDCLQLKSERFGDSMDLVTTLTREFSSAVMFLVLHRGTKTVRVFSEGDLLGDLYLREDSGRWVSRNFEGLLDKLRSACKLNATSFDIAKNVFRKAWQLSLDRAGAILVIADGRPEAVGRSRVQHLNMRLDVCPDYLFRDLSTMDDGAVWISWEGSIERAGVIVRTPKDDAEDDHAELGGARHAAARSISAQLDRALVFAVSENGGISAFWGGTDVFYRE